VKSEDLKPNKILRGPLFPEPVQVLIATPMGTAVKLIGKGLNTSKLFDLVLTPEKLALTTPDTEPFDGDPLRVPPGHRSHAPGSWPSNTTLTSRCPSRGLIRCRTSLKRFTTISWRCHASGSCWPTTPAPARPSWPACSQGAEDSRPREAHAHHHAGQPLLPVAARNEGQVPREFRIIRSDVLRANYGSNPWQDKNQVITSVSWVSRIEDAKESLLRSHWDLIIVDEAHKMSAASRDKRRSPTTWGGTSQDDRSLPADDRHAAQGRPGKLLPLPRIA
jgi:hypothetical protein